MSTASRSLRIGTGRRRPIRELVAAGVLVAFLTAGVVVATQGTSPDRAAPPARQTGAPSVDARWYPKQAAAQARQASRSSVGFEDPRWTPKQHLAEGVATHRR